MRLYQEYEYHARQFFQQLRDLARMAKALESMLSGKTILLGFYQGLGDFLSAVPVMNQLLDQDNKLFVVASAPNHQLFKLLKIKDRGITLIDFNLEASNNWSKFNRLIRTLSATRADYVFVSPHAERNVSSWKLPLLLWFLRRTVWRRTGVIGAGSERLSCLFDTQVPVDRSSKLVKREWELHANFGSIASASEPSLEIFDPSSLGPGSQSLAALVIHPGASRSNKNWPVSHWQSLVTRLDEDLEISFIGLPNELEPIKRELAPSARVKFLSGTILEAVEVISASSLCVTMDSGFSHVAAFLGVRHLAIFGSTDPSLYGPTQTRTKILYEPQLECQPCHQHDCPYEGIPCMSGITPAMVHGAITELLPQSVSE